MANKKYEYLTNEEIQKLLNQPIDKGKRASKSDVSKIRKELEELKLTSSPEEKVEFDKMLHQLNGDYELWLKNNGDILTITCIPLHKNAESINHYSVFSIPNPQITKGE